MQWFWEEGRRGGRTWRRPDVLVPDSMARILWGGGVVQSPQGKAEAPSEGSRSLGRSAPQPSVICIQETSGQVLSEAGAEEG